jgi:HK97 family phage prohead protease
MPYFISNKNPDCSGWAVEKEDGEVMGCHQSKQDAVDQMVAISLAEDMAPGGERAVDLKLPAYIQNAAAKGLEYNAQGLGGDGLVERTIREARLMADGQISEDKVIRANAWGQRHLVDLDASQNSEADDEGFPGAGAVAFYLWGIDPLDPEPAMTWFAGKAQAIKDDQVGAQRTTNSEDVVIVDIDGTLIAGGQGIQKNVDYVNALYEKFFIYIVTGRGDADEDKTIAELADAGVKYDDIEFNEDLSIPTPEYKGNKAADILSEQTVVLAIDNDPAARRAYFDLGIKTLDPKRIKSGDMPMMREAPAFHRQREQDFGNVSYMTEQVETRRVTVSDFELRANESGDGMSFTGYAAVFNSPSEPLPFIETIAPGAFARSLKARNNIRMYMNHDSSMLLATTRAKTLRLQEDSKGLLASADLPETSVGKDLSILMKRGDVTSMSFGFTVPSGGDRWSEDGMNRELRQIKLFEVSVVTGFPAYSATSAQVRSFDALATRTGVDADRLADAILVLESGQTLSPDQGALLRETVAKLEPIPTEPPATLGLMAKHLELIKNF